MSTQTPTPTDHTYTAFDRAYAHFNAALFEGALPPCLITMQRRKHSYGYFHGDTWQDADGLIVTDEIALNPDTFQERETAATLSTLVHEMCHLHQHHFGKPGRRGYHNREWAALMEGAGLNPSDTGAEGGKRIGQSMSHYIVEGGPFARACAALLAGGFIIPWTALTAEAEQTTRTRKAASKTKYTCPDCALNIWGKPEIKIICGECMATLEAEEAEA